MQSVCRVCEQSNRQQPQLCEQCQELLDTMCGMQDPEWWWFFDVTPAEEQEEADVASVAVAMAMVVEEEQSSVKRQAPVSRGPQINELLRRITSHRLYWQLGPRVHQSLEKISGLPASRRVRRQNDYVRQVWHWIAAQSQQAVDDKIQAICVY